MSKWLVVLDVLRTALAAVARLLGRTPAAEPPTDPVDDLAARQRSASLSRNRKRVRWWA